MTQAFAIDLTGQVCTESLDGALYGGVSNLPSPSTAARWLSTALGGMAIVALLFVHPLQGRSATCPLSVAGSSPS